MSYHVPGTKYHQAPAATLHRTDTAQVTGHKGAEDMAAALDSSDVVVIPAGVPRKPGMTR